MNFLKNSEYTKDDLKNLIHKAVKENEEGLEPIFYAVGGSRVTGFADEDSDIDIHGFHIADGKKYMQLDKPKQQMIINKNENPTQGFEDHYDVEIESYELRKFGKLMLKTNFNFLEAIFFGKEIINNDPEAVEDIRSILEQNLPADVHYHYRGMAKQNYYRNLKPEKETYEPTPKKYLYVLRGVLAADYVQEKGEMEPHVQKLAEELLDSTDQKIITKLVEAKRNHKEEPSEELKESAEQLIQRYLQKEEKNVDKNREKFRQQIDNWMMNLRKKHQKD